MTYQPTLGYIAFYNRNRIELYANSLLIAKTRAIAYFNVPKSKQHLVAVELADQETV